MLQIRSAVSQPGNLSTSSTSYKQQCFMLSINSFSIEKNPNLVSPSDSLLLSLSLSLLDLALCIKTAPASLGRDISKAVDSKMVLQIERTPQFHIWVTGTHFHVINIFCIALCIDSRLKQKYRSTDS